MPVAQLERRRSDARECSRHGDREAPPRHSAHAVPRGGAPCRATSTKIARVDDPAVAAEVRALRAGDAPPRARASSGSSPPEAHDSNASAPAPRRTATTTPARRPRSAPGSCASAARRDRGSRTIAVDRRLAVSNASYSHRPPERGRVAQSTRYRPRNAGRSGNQSTLSPSAPRRAPRRAARNARGRRHRDPALTPMQSDARVHVEAPDSHTPSPADHGVRSASRSLRSRERLVERDGRASPRAAHGSAPRAAGPRAILTAMSTGSKTPDAATSSSSTWIAPATAQHRFVQLHPLRSSWTSCDSAPANSVRSSRSRSSAHSMFPPCRRSPQPNATKQKLLSARPPFCVAGGDHGRRGEDLVDERVFRGQHAGARIDGRPTRRCSTRSRSARPRTACRTSPGSDRVPGARPRTLRRRRPCRSR